MKTKHSFVDEDNKKKDRPRCPDCCFYLDGNKQADNFGGLIMTPLAGMRFYKYSYGTIAMRVGSFVPCDCETGRLIEKTWVRADGGKNSPLMIHGKKEGDNNGQAHTYSDHDIKKLEEHMAMPF